ncbi:hypothetical protein Hanom_Chr07g00620931 [Helianthus anomalus]
MIFFSNKEEECKNRLQVPDLDSIEDATQVTVDLLQFHNQLVLLLQYYELNFDGIHFRLVRNS